MANAVAAPIRPPPFNPKKTSRGTNPEVPVPFGLDLSSQSCPVTWRSTSARTNPILRPETIKSRIIEYRRGVKRIVTDTAPLVHPQTCPRAPELSQLPNHFGLLFTINIQGNAKPAIHVPHQQRFPFFAEILLLEYFRGTNNRLAKRISSFI